MADERALRIDQAKLSIAREALYLRLDRADRLLAGLDPVDRAAAMLTLVGENCRQLRRVMRSADWVGLDVIRCAIDPVDYFVVACSKDVTMRRCHQDPGAADRIELREITELLEEALLSTHALGTAGSS